MKKNNIGVIDLGISNINSIINAFKKIKVTATKVSNAKDISAYDKLILPGVGSFDSAMLKIKNDGWFDELNFAVNDKNKKFLGICLGMQLMCDFSEEGNTDCLKIFDSNVKRFKSTLKVPQIGWNTVFDLKTSLFDSINENEYMYLVHSYYVPLIDETSAQSFYSLNYSVAIEKNNFYGVQFHPEKSSADGLLLLENFLKL